MLILQILAIAALTLTGTLTMYMKGMKGFLPRTVATVALLLAGFTIGSIVYTRKREIVTVCDKEGNIVSIDGKPVQQHPPFERK